MTYSPGAGLSGVVVSTISQESPFCSFAGAGMAGITTTAASASYAWPSANLAMYWPIVLPAAVTLTKLWCLNGAAVSGNIDVAVYNEAGVRQISAGSTAQAGTNTVQSFDVTDTPLAAGRYYLAVALNNTTGTLRGWTLNATTEHMVSRALGTLYQSSAFALPSTASFTAPDGSALGSVAIVGMLVSPRTTI